MRPARRKRFPASGAWRQEGPGRIEESPEPILGLTTCGAALEEVRQEGDRGEGDHGEEEAVQVSHGVLWQK